MNKCEQFEQDMVDADIEVAPYRGRHFYDGPAVRTSRDGPSLQDVMRATAVAVQWDHLGLNLVVYPK